MRLLSLALITVLTGGMTSGMASAETPLTIEQFERQVTGKVMLHFKGSGQSFGAEEYLPNRRVRWAFPGGGCAEGSYFQDDGHICYVYDRSDMGQVCWQYIADAEGLRARIKGRLSGGFDILLREKPGRLSCAGP